MFAAIVSQEKISNSVTETLKNWIKSQIKKKKMKYKYRLGNFCSVHNETQIILNATKDSVRESCAQLIYFYAASLVKPQEDANGT